MLLHSKAKCDMVVTMKGGTVEEEQIWICPNCAGTGRIASCLEQWSIGGTRCETCDGTGEVEPWDEEEEE